MSNGREQEIVSAMDAAAFTLRHRFVIVFTAMALALLLIAHALLSPRAWTSEASFTPEAGLEAAGANMLQLASQFGFNLDLGMGGESPQFYARLLRTEKILSEIATDTYSVRAGGRDAPSSEMRGTIAELREIEEENRAIRVQRTIEWLENDAIGVSTARETGIVAVEVTTPWPDLSKAVTERLVELTNQFNLESRQSQAAAERRFIEERMEDVNRELEAAEARLERFLQNNRGFENSPELRFDRDRLQRQLSMRQQLYSTLVQSYEQARIGEVRNTPVITVVQPATEPVEPDSRHMVLRLAIGLVLGSAIGIGAGLALDYWRREKEQATQEYRDVVSLWRETKHDFGRVLSRDR